MDQIETVKKTLRAAFDAAEDKRSVLRSADLRSVMDGIRDVPADQKAAYGQAVNTLKKEVQSWVDKHEADQAEAAITPIDVTAPRAVNATNATHPGILGSSHGTIHPLTTELERITDIYQRMGYVIEESRELDDDYHMFGSLNFPEGHPARDDFDTFITTEGLIAPAHTSTMQNRVMQKYRSNLDAGEPIAVLIPDRVFRNEDLDATHEHTFHQIEGVYVNKGVTVGNLVQTLKTYLSEFFGEELLVKIQPFYFPFTEPSFEFAVERPSILRKNNSEEQKWLELGGCGMIHPNVLREAGLDPTVYTGFAWGFGVERMDMWRPGIEDIRLFQSGLLAFLRQFL